MRGGLRVVGLVFLWSCGGSSVPGRDVTRPQDSSPVVEDAGEADLPDARGLEDALDVGNDMADDTPSDGRDSEDLESQSDGGLDGGPALDDGRASPDSDDLRDPSGVHPDFAGDEVATEDGPRDDGTDGEVCVPSCEGLACGPDGCGGDCGPCPEGFRCVASECKAVREFVVDFKEIPNVGVNTFTVNGHPAAGGLVGPSLTADGLTLYYVRQDDSAPCYGDEKSPWGPYTCSYKHLGGTEGDIWRARRESTDPAAVWKDPVRLPKCAEGCVNSPGYEVAVSISRWDGGRVLYFASARTGAAGYAIWSAVLDEASGEFVLQDRSEFAKMDDALPMTSKGGCELSEDGRYMVFTVTPLLPGGGPAGAFRTTCEVWDEGEDRCALWGTPVSLDVLNQSVSDDPLVEYLLTTPGYRLGPFAPSIAPNLDIYYVLGAPWWLVIGGDWIVKVKNQGPGLEPGTHKVEVVRGAINGVKNYVTHIMMKDEPFLDGHDFYHGWYVETPSLWQDPTTGRTWIFAHSNSRIWFGEVIEDTVECYNDVDCEDGLSCDGYERCVSHTCQPGEPVLCDDQDPGTQDSCDETYDVCRHEKR